jgi:diguanylate cyclase (GGDEF)-like protein
VISLKKYLDMRFETSHPAEPAGADLFEAAIQSYRLSLLDMGSSGYQACPAFGASLQQSLTELTTRLTGTVSPKALEETRSQVSDQLSQWGERTAEHLKEKAQEIKDLLMVLARTAESLGERDHRYTAQLQQFTTHLRSVADLEDFTQVRSSLMQAAGELKTCVEQMEQDSQLALSQLESKVSSYENRLKETEELALRDLLTGLPNRLYLERRLQWKIENGQTFSLAFLDLNQFKAVNDRYGHPAGDLLLKQFSGELKSNVRPCDVVGRWGGDEFVIMLDCNLAAATLLLERVRKWVFGDYTIAPEGQADKIKIWVSAAVGIAQWKAGEPVENLIDRADRTMYEDKKSSLSMAVGRTSGMASISALS